MRQPRCAVWRFCFVTYILRAIPSLGSGGQLSFGVRPMTIWQSLLVGCAVALLLALLSWLTIWPGKPQIDAQLNLAVVSPMFLMGEIVDESVAAVVACAVVPLLFCVWCWPALRGRVELPIRSNVLLVITLLLSVAWLLLGYRYGIEYQSTTYVVRVTVISIGFWAALVVLAFNARRRPSTSHNRGFHVVMFAWIAWYAFPYVGELP